MNYQGPHPEEGEEHRKEYRRDEDVAIHLKGNKLPLIWISAGLAALLSVVVGGTTWGIQLNAVSMKNAEDNGRHTAAIAIIQTQIQQVVTDQVKLATILENVSKQMDRMEDRQDKLHPPKFQ